MSMVSLRVTGSYGLESVSNVIKLKLIIPLGFYLYPNMLCALQTGLCVIMEAGLSIVLEMANLM
jgi:hypothetical protein